MNTLSRMLSGLASPLGVVLVILFFLPWLEINCQGARLATQTGWQLTTGKSSSAQDEGGPAMKVEKEGDDDDGPDARWGYIVGLIVPLAITLVGLLALGKVLRGPGAGVLLAILGIVGLVVVILAANVDYSDEILADAREEAQSSGGPMPPEAIAEAISTEPLAALWVSLVLYILVLLCGGGAVLAAPRLSPVPRRPGLPVASPAPPDG